jgi:predicted acylesterase/phospholipase RssA
MVVSQSRHSPSTNKKPKIGLSLGGGGALGGIYEIGALRALDEALEGLDLNDLFVYVGVNSGAFIASNLANQMTSAQMCRIFVKNEAEVHPFHPEVFYRPAIKEYFNRIKAIPSLAVEAGFRFLSNYHDQNLLEALTVLSQAVPSGLFDNEGVHEYLKRSYSMMGRTNDFRQLSRRLYLIATDLESSRAVKFGAPGYDHVPISRAVQASIATPALYVPVEVDGRHYLDGTLCKGMHASVALEEGADLVIGVNPVVPVDVSQAVASGSMSMDMLTNSGMPNVLSQAYRTMLSSRMRAGMAMYETEYPNAKVVRFEPTRDDAKLFFSNIFSFQARRMVCEHAYQMTRKDLRRRADELDALFSPFGITLNRDILRDEQRTISTSLYGEMLPLYVSKEAGIKKGRFRRISRHLEGATDRLQRSRQIS